MKTLCLSLLLPLTAHAADYRANRCPIELLMPVDKRPAPPIQPGVYVIRGVKVEIGQPRWESHMLCPLVPVENPPSNPSENEYDFESGCLSQYQSWWGWHYDVWDCRSTDPCDYLFDAVIQDAP